MVYSSEFRNFSFGRHGTIIGVCRVPVRGCLGLHRAIVLKAPKSSLRCLLALPISNLSIGTLEGWGGTTYYAALTIRKEGFGL